ncbi:MAG: MoxR family ATPase [Bacteroidetes bacterium]|nr:MoxR family ATPase [Bacteroidota bacterium]
MVDSIQETQINIQQLNEQIQHESAFVDAIQQEISKVLVGQKFMVSRLLIGILTEGHVLLEGLPGLAKTLAVNTLAQTVNAGFSRIQFTPDLLPADLLGTMIYNQAKGDFEVRKGPIFSNFILADEINRAPAKVQSALLEAMQEKQVSIGKNTYQLPKPFLVLATQNPIEQEGTYPLPEAQVDRFMLKVKIDYPNIDEERQILKQSISQIQPTINAVASTEQLLKARQTVKSIYMDEKIENYILDIVFATRECDKKGLGKLQNLIAFGASPRATISLAFGAKAYAFLQKRGYVIPEDVRAIAFEVLRHRIGVTYEAEAEEVTSEDIIREVLNKVDVP